VEAGITRGGLDRSGALTEPYQRAWTQRLNHPESHHLPLSKGNFKGLDEKDGFNLQAKWLILYFPLFFKG